MDTKPESFSPSPSSLPDFRKQTVSGITHSPSPHYTQSNSPATAFKIPTNNAPLSSAPPPDQSPARTTPIAAPVFFSPGVSSPFTSASASPVPSPVSPLISADMSPSPSPSPLSKGITNAGISPSPHPPRPTFSTSHPPSASGNEPISQLSHKKRLNKTFSPAPQPNDSSSVPDSERAFHLPTSKPLPTTLTFPRTGASQSLIIGALFAGILTFTLVVILIYFITRKSGKREPCSGHDPKGCSCERGPRNSSPKCCRSELSTPHSSSPDLSQQILPVTVSHRVHNGSAKGGRVKPSLSRNNAFNLRHGFFKFMFSYEELAAATDGFSVEKKLGEGGFGCVYKGVLPDGHTVAVKHLKRGVGKGRFELEAEVEIISRVHHRNLVSLLGCCKHFNQWLLVYDYFPNGNLEQHLHGTKGVGRVLDWATRYKIAKGAARGLAYLHEDCQPRIIHRDIKSSNILLDSNFEAKVSDFGFAKFTNDADSHVTTRVMGTIGYVAPEYASSGKLTESSDIYSFGVLLLELVTGRKAVEPVFPFGNVNLVEWVRPMLKHAFKDGTLDNLVDPRLKNNFDHGEVFCILEAAAACVRQTAQMRPRMGLVARSLEGNSGTSDLTNGVRPGCSVQFSSEHAALVRTFQQLAFGTPDRDGDEIFRSDEFGTQFSYQ